MLFWKKNVFIKCVIKISFSYYLINKALCDRYDSSKYCM